MKIASLYLWKVNLFNANPPEANILRGIFLIYQSSNFHCLLKLSIEVCPSQRERFRRLFQTPRHLLPRQPLYNSKRLIN